MATETVSQEVSKRAGWSIFMGVLTAAVGVLMILYPLAAGTISTVFVGWTLLVVSIAQFVFAFSSQTAGQVFFKLLLGILYGIAGFALVAFPGIGLVTLTAMLGGMLIGEAIVEWIIAGNVPAEAGRGWLVLNGLLSLLLGALILLKWPESSVYAIGTMVGVGVFFNGVTRIAISSKIRQGVRAFERVAAA